MLRKPLAVIGYWALICPPTWAVPPTLPGWDVTWYDDFNGSQVDTSLWNVIFSTNPTNNSQHAYLPSQVSVSRGNLVITSSNQPFGELPYSSGQVISKNVQQYGRWEVRANLPTSRGMWPAIWLLPQAPWPSQGEIDIMENRGDQPHLTSSAFHWGTNPPFSHSFVSQDQQAVHGGSAVNYHDSFHTYGVEWEPTQVRFYVDGVHHYTVYDSDTGGFLSQQTAGMQTIINTAVGGDFLDNPDGTTIWPQHFLIDYVHVYEAADAPAPLTFENGQFDTNGGTLADWSTFGNALPNVQANNNAVRSGPASLKLFGQYNGQQNFSGVEQGISVTPGDELRAIARSLVRSADTIAGTGNEAQLKIDFYNTRHGRFGTPDYLSSQQITIANASSANNVWLDNELRVTVPGGAVEARVALVFRQPNNEGGTVHIDDVLFGRRGDYTLTWDGLGDGDWSDNHWTGAALDQPTDFDRAVLRTNRITLNGSGAAFETSVESGMLQLNGTLHGDVTIDQAGSVAAGSGTSTVDGNLTLDGTQFVDQVATLVVTGSADVDGAQIAVSDSYAQVPGTLSGEFTLIDAASVTGTFATTDGGGVDAHLGEGHFLNSITHEADRVLIEIYAAIPGDADGNGFVDGQDFIIWNANKFRGGTDWLSGDFNGDRFTDGADFIIWNQHKFTNLDLVTAVPEPGVVSVIGLFGWCLARRRRPGHSTRSRTPASARVT